MLNQSLKGVFFLAISLSSVSYATAQRGQGPGFGKNGLDDQRQCLALINSTPKQALDSMEEAGLIYMREEEKLAHDVYALLHAKWGLRIFGNISQSEERHMDALKLLLDRYSLQDPADGKPTGGFQNEGLQELYFSLVAEGERSVQSALKVGATIEETDIRDLIKAAESTNNNDLQTVYQNLRLASENHLRSFVQQLSAVGDSYVPQHIDQARFSQILASQQPRGRSNGMQGNGRGFGRGNNGDCPPVNP